MGLWKLPRSGHAHSRTSDTRRGTHTPAMVPNPLHAGRISTTMAAAALTTCLAVTVVLLCALEAHPFADTAISADGTFTWPPYVTCPLEKQACVHIPVSDIVHTQEQLVACRAAPAAEPRLPLQCPPHQDGLSECVGPAMANASVHVLLRLPELEFTAPRSGLRDASTVLPARLLATLSEVGESLQADSRLRHAAITLVGGTRQVAALAEATLRSYTVLPYFHVSRFANANSAVAALLARGVHSTAAVVLAGDWQTTHTISVRNHYPEAKTMDTFNKLAQHNDVQSLRLRREDIQADSSWDLPAHDAQQVAIALGTQVCCSPP